MVSNDDNLRAPLAGNIEVREPRAVFEPKPEFEHPVPGAQMQIRATVTEVEFVRRGLRRFWMATIHVFGGSGLTMDLGDNGDALRVGDELVLLVIRKVREG